MDDMAQGMLDKVDLTQLDKLTDELYEVDSEIRSLENRKKALQGRIKLLLAVAGQRSFENGTYRLWLQDSARPVHLKCEVTQIPRDYWVVKPNEAAIRKAIDAGEDLSPWCELEEAGTFVRVTGK